MCYEMDVERANPYLGPCLPTSASAAATLDAESLLFFDIHCLMCWLWWHLLNPISQIPPFYPDLGRLNPILSSFFLLFLFSCAFLLEECLHYQKVPRIRFISLNYPRSSLKKYLYCSKNHLHLKKRNRGGPFKDGIGSSSRGGNILPRNWFGRRLNAERHFSSSYPLLLLLPRRRRSRKLAESASGQSEETRKCSVGLIQIRTVPWFLLCFIEFIGSLILTSPSMIGGMKRVERIQEYIKTLAAQNCESDPFLQVNNMTKLKLQNPNTEPRFMILICGRSAHL